jgi:ribonuclease D
MLSTNLQHILNQILLLYDDILIHSNIQGIDAEWHPYRTPATISLLQLANADTVVLFRLNMLQRIPHPLQAVLRDSSIIKAGLGVLDDLLKLKDSHSVESNGIAEINKMPLHIRCRPRSLQGLTGLFLSSHLKKDRQIVMSNWETYKGLSQEQILYAGTFIT